MDTIINVNDKEFLTVQEVADLLGVHVETIRRKIRDNSIKSTCRFNKYYVLKSDLTEYMAQANNTKIPNRTKK